MEVARRGGPGGSRVGGKEKGGQRGRLREGGIPPVYFYRYPSPEFSPMPLSRRLSAKDIALAPKKEKKIFFSPRSQIQMAMTLENIFRSPQTSRSNELVVSPSFYSKRMS